MGKPRIVILGGGPAGLGAAFQLARRGLAQVTLLERNSAVGGNAGSFEVAGMRVDYGSHRLHPACDPEILGDIHALLGDDLLDRPRHGRIRLQGRWIHFPLKPLDLAFKLPPRFTANVGMDITRRAVRGKANRSDAETFASVMQAGLGQTICQDFYFPYARKLWGLEPGEISPTQARRRVRAGSIGKMLGKVLSVVPGLKPKGSGRFFYPRRGYGEISEGYYRAAVSEGAQVLLNSSVQSVETTDGRVILVRYQRDGEAHSLPADYVWSTIPITILARALKPTPPAELLCAAECIDYRAMILIYLVLEQDRFSEYDAHYFPEPDIPISRMSEPKNYGAAREPEGVTVLCGELPCSPGSPEWAKSDAELGALMCDSLVRAGIPPRGSVRQVVTRRLRQAYPIYRTGYEAHFERLDEWVGRVEGLLTFGRQGLFAHDNTHHALYMAYSAAKCLNEDGHFDHSRWQAYRRIFETHVVED
jgi:protoporphyrinogen oxidase